MPDPKEYLTIEIGWFQIGISPFLKQEKILEYTLVVDTKQVGLYDR
jgi:hypothetical protein